MYASDVSLYASDVSLECCHTRMPYQVPLDSDKSLTHGANLNIGCKEDHMLVVLKQSFTSFFSNLSGIYNMYASVCVSVTASNSADSCCSLRY